MRVHFPQPPFDVFVLLKNTENNNMHILHAWIQLIVLTFRIADDIVRSIVRMANKVK